jgi:hypothetical protein
MVAINAKKKKILLHAGFERSVQEFIFLLGNVLPQDRKP